MSKESKLRKIRWGVWFASIMLFVISLFCPTYCTTSSCDGAAGGFVDLIAGWLGALFGGGVYLAWLANPFFLIAIFTNKNSPGVSIVLSIFALIAGLSFLRGGEILLNEAGHTAYITGYQIGYWLWIASFFLMLVASILSIKTSNYIVEHHIDPR
jgi:energy-coupling factor transporter transmembrane protein EcfT